MCSELIAVLTFTSIWPWIFGALAICLLVSGLDDLAPLVIRAWHAVVCRGPRKPPTCDPAPYPGHERMIAIFVPCWKESEVIGQMVRHNLAVLRYRNFDIFLGVYPNDKETLEVAEALSEALPNVHVAPCLHPGPTSKADCLNWVYQCMLIWERIQGIRFDTIVLHDAEDMIHPEALQLINRERANYAMVQVPVLPLPTPLADLTHGIYCDEFAEYQTLDMPARGISKSFIPSNGVGTGFAREILERLAKERQNKVFDPASLTEDYEIGVYAHKAGYSQLFAPLRGMGRDIVATREYFPRRVRSAIRQRTRWVTGIALQGWERDGWRGSWRVKYWFWRDRKGLLTNPLSLATNLLFVAGVADWIICSYTHHPWAFAISNPVIGTLCWLTLLLQVMRMCLRMACVGRIFGPFFALGVPLRIFHANLINSCASIAAVRNFALAKIHGRALAWQKTDHAYFDHQKLQPQRRELAEVLVSLGCLSEELLAQARQQVPADGDLGNFLLERGMISEQDLCHAISVQCGLPTTHVDTESVRIQVVRSLPLHVQKRFGIVPFRVHAGRLLIAGARAPATGVFEELKSFTRLPVDFQLVTQGNFDELSGLL